MIIYPAIDLKDGQCVRLTQGDFDRVVIFDNEPSAIAKKWFDAGASFIHVVDLDGARFGSEHNNEAIAKITNAVSAPIQVGGGIRNMRDIESKFEIGVNRVILGTAAINDLTFVKEAVRRYGSQIAIGIDALDGNVAVDGWEKVSNTNVLDLCKNMESLGVKTIIYTDISKDGMMIGPNFETTAEVNQAVSCDIIAAGGVSNMCDLENLDKLNLHGAIIGKALYQNSIKLREAIEMFELGAQN